MCLALLDGHETFGGVSGIKLIRNGLVIVNLNY